MNSENRRQQQLEHLAHVLSLSKAVASAISAIEKNDLRQFENHLAVQETMCNRLSASASTLSCTATARHTVGPEMAGPEDVDMQLQEEIREAHAALGHLNRVYAALLKQARKSVALMLALYRHHVPAPQCHTWSCEA